MMTFNHKNIQRTLLVVSISSIMLTGLTACGGSDDYQATDCNGSQSVGCGSTDKPNNPNPPNKPTTSSPVAKSDEASTEYNKSVTINVLENDKDADNDLDKTTLKLIHPTNKQLVNEVVVSNEGMWKIESGKVSFTPNATLQNKTVSIDYSIDDKDASTQPSTATISVVVGKKGNTAPIAKDNHKEITDDKVVTGNVITDADSAGKDSDPDNDPLTIKNFMVNNTTYQAGQTASIKGTNDAQAGSLVINADGSYTYTPSLGFGGDLSIKYTLTDGKLTHTAQLAFKVTATVKAFDWSNVSRDSSKIEALSKQNSTSWVASYADETPQDLAIADDDAVVATYWHNKAHSFTLSDNVATLQADFDFATNSGSRHDVVSGASEQLLEGMVISDDGKLIAGAVTKASENTTGEKGVGLYVSQADSSGTFTPVIHASSDSKSYYSYSNITAYAINNTNKNLAVANKSGAIKILSSALDKTVSQVSVDFEVSALAFSDDGKHLFVSGKKKTGIFSSEGVVVMLKISDMSEAWRWKNTDTLVQLISLGDTRVLARPSTGKALFILGNDDGGSTVKTKTIAIAGSPTDITVSADNQTIAVSQLKQVEVINLDNNKRAGITVSDKIAGIGLSGKDNNQYLWTASKSKVTSYSMPSGFWQ